MESDFVTTVKGTPVDFEYYVRGDDYRFNGNRGELFGEIN